MEDLRNRLTDLRSQNDMTQAQLSQKLGVTKSVISAYETGWRMPSYDILISISQLFKVTTDHLLGATHRHELDLSGLTDEEISHFRPYRGG